MTQSIHRFENAVHQWARLRILALLCTGARADFAHLRDTLELTDGNLSRSIGRLEDAGYVRVEKVVEAGRSRTWLTATAAGRAALDVEIATLREIIAGLEIAHAPRSAQIGPVLSG